jgi:hypothetical protein
MCYAHTNEGYLFLDNILNKPYGRYWISHKGRLAPGL